MKQHKNKLFLKILFPAVLCFLVFSFFAFAYAQKDLEVTYPQTPGTTPPQSTETSLPDYVRYIFTFVIGISGAIGLGAMVYAGVSYINSVGDPTAHSNARSRLVSAFWGGILLLGSYALLQLINPNMTTLNITEPESIPAVDLPATPITPIPTADLLTRIKQLAQTTKETLDIIKTSANNISTETNQCNCQNTKPICACEKSGQAMMGDWLLTEGYDMEVYLNNDAQLNTSLEADLTANVGSDPGLKCNPKMCYTGNSYNPCSNHDKISELEKKIVDLRDVVLYYNGRTAAEKNDLSTDIQNFIDPKINWYNQQISEVNNGTQTDEALKSTTIQYLNERKGWLEQEKQYKTQIAVLMQTLGEALKKINEPATKLPQLTSQCFSNVKSKCKPTCKQGSDNGCHDKVKGCQPDQCTGGNPCPTSEIQQETGKIQSFSQMAQSICEQITGAVDSIQKSKTPVSHF